MVIVTKKTKVSNREINSTANMANEQVMKMSTQTINRITGSWEFQWYNMYNNIYMI